jgi:flagellar assembly protein FliH
MSTPSNMTAWERWELASFDTVASTVAGGAAKLSANGELPALPLDRAAIERICEEAHADGYQAGYQSGFQIGKRTGYDEGKAAAQAEANRIGLAADNLDQALQEFDQQVADELVALAVEIARQVVRREITARPEAILAVVNEALAQLPHQHSTIYLNPEDASLVRSHLGDGLAHAGHRILEESALKPGDCLLESGGSQIDATTATRWRRVIESLGVVATLDIPE